jgi:adenylate cyclase
MSTFLKRLFKITAFRLATLITIICIIIYFLKPSFLELMELKVFDLRFLSRRVKKPGSEIVIATIDEKSLDELGRWPWPRTIIAQLVDKLSSCQVKAIGFDIVFPEPDENSQLKSVISFKRKVEELNVGDPRLTNFLSQVEKGADTDRILTSAIKRSQNVVLGYFFHTTLEEVKSLKKDLLEKRIDSILSSEYTMVKFTSRGARSYPLVEGRAVESNLASLSSAATSSGYFNIFPDVDGTVRWIPLVIKCEDHYFAPLSLQVLRRYLDSPPLSIKIADFGIESIRLGNLTIPTDEQGRMLINYRGYPRTFPCYSITDILHDRITKDTFKDKIVLVGATAIGIYDIRVTPFASIFPGLEIHANVIDNILRGDFLMRPNWLKVFDLLAILLIGTILGIFIPKIKALWGLISSLSFFAIYLSIDRYLFQHLNLWLSIVYPFIALFTVYTGITVYRYVTEEREKKKIKGAFQQYVTEAVVNEMLKNPDKLKLGGEKKELTVLFSDIRGFTTISEQMSPEVLVKFLNEYLTVMTDIVFKYNGLLDKYMGDAIMAVFGAPLDQKDHALKACLTSLEMMEELKRLKGHWESQGMPVLNIGVGINSGPMVVGNMGSERRFDYTVMGDNVNLGSRLEGLNKQYGTNIIVSEFTVNQISDQLIFRELDLVRVKGKEQAVKIFELMGRGEPAPEVSAFLEHYHKGIMAYQSREWDRGVDELQKALALSSQDYPARMYIDRCIELKENPPAECWDCVYTSTTK